MIWFLDDRFNPQHARDMCGMILNFISTSDPRPAYEQIDEHYGHGGGWIPFHGFEQLENGDLAYSPDPPARTVAYAYLRDEIVRIHEYAWVSITQSDGSFEVARID